MDRGLIRKLAGKKYRRYLAAALCVALLLLLILPSSDKKQAEEESTVSPDIASAYSYVSASEERLARLLSQIDGAGECEVMLAFEGSEEYIFAADLTTSGSIGDGKESTQTDRRLYTAGGSSDKQPVLTKILAPRITGALIVCRGAASPAIKERVIKAAAAALDLPTSKICVENRR